MSFEWVDDDMVQSLCGGVAQLGERLPCTQEVIGSTPFTSTKFTVWLSSVKRGIWIWRFGWKHPFI